MGDTIEIWSLNETEQAFMEPKQFGEALENIMTDNKEQ
jgi:hypothetical protein